MEKVSQHENEGKKKESGTDISTDVCLFLFIGLIVGWQKTAELVKQAIQSISYALTKVNLFHSDRGKEFDNQLIDEMLETFGITRSLSQAGCPYDNAVAESTYRSFKLEFINQETFQSLEELPLKLRIISTGGIIIAFKVLSITKHL